MISRYDCQLRLKDILVLMEAKDSNGVARYPLGSESRTNLVAEARLWLDLIKQEDES